MLATRADAVSGPARNLRQAKACGVTAVPSFDPPLQVAHLIDEQPQMIKQLA